MNINNIPRVRLTLDHMRHEIIHAFNRYADGLKDDVAAEVERAIQSFDYRNEIAKIADGILRQEIQKALEGAFQSMRWDSALRKSLVEIMRRELAKQVRKPPPDK